VIALLGFRRAGPEHRVSGQGLAFNGRTGRIINVLYLVKQGLLDIPVLYLSRHIVRTKTDYYRLLQEARDRDTWEDWVLYMLTAVEQTAADGIATTNACFLSADGRISAAIGKSVPLADGGGNRERPLPKTIRMEEAVLQISILIFQPVGQVSIWTGGIGEAATRRNRRLA
jgi:hypothetical protein